MTGSGQVRETISTKSGGKETCGTDPGGGGFEFDQYRFRVSKSWTSKLP